MNDVAAARVDAALADVFCKLRASTLALRALANAKKSLDNVPQTSTDASQPTLQAHLNDAALVNAACEKPLGFHIAAFFRYTISAAPEGGNLGEAENTFESIEHCSFNVDLATKMPLAHAFLFIAKRCTAWQQNIEQQHASTHAVDVKMHRLVRQSALALRTACDEAMQQDVEGIAHVRSSQIAAISPSPRNTCTKLLVGHGRSNIVHLLKNLQNDANDASRSKLAPPVVISGYDRSRTLGGYRIRQVRRLRRCVPHRL